MALCCAPHPPLTHPITGTPSLIKTMLEHNPYSSLGTTASSVWKFYYAQVLCLLPSIHYCWSKLNTLKEKVSIWPFTLLLCFCYINVIITPRILLWNKSENLSHFKKINCIFQMWKNMYSNGRNLGENKTL